jgi:hypothetical protein
MSEVPGLLRYGFWLVMTHALGALTGGIDDLVIAGTCGAAAVPPWAIGKRLWLMAHTFLAQHTEHLIPTLGSLGNTARSAFDSVAMAMHWYVMLLAAVGYTLMASIGDLLVGVVAGDEVAATCRPAIIAFSLLGIAYALLIIPVVMSLAEGASRPAFVVACLSNAAQILAVIAVAKAYGAPAVYYAPVAAMPFLLVAVGTTGKRIFDPDAAAMRLKPVVTPLAIGLIGVVASRAITSSDFSGWLRLAAGGMLAVAVFVAIITLERVLNLNPANHLQLQRVVRHAGSVAALTARTWIPSMGRKTTGTTR